jgi:acetyl-CoA C-acetyltransferase
MRTDIGVRRVAVLGGVRIPFARAIGAYADIGNQEMLTAVFRGLVDRFRLSGERLGEVAAGAVIKHPGQWNLARESVLGSGLAPETPAFDLQRACGTSLEAAIAVANKIALGQIDSGIAAGTDTVSDTPIVYPHEYQQLLIASARGRSLGARMRPWLGLRPRHFRPVTPSVTEPRTGLSMGQSCEVMAKQWSVTRAEQDELAADSHRKAAAAYAAGFYRDLVVDFHGLDADNNIRPGASVEQLGRLKPAFDRSGAGTLTAGNSTPLTDGAAAVLLASEDWAARHGVQPLAYLTHVKVHAVNFVTREGLLMAPAYAVPPMLKEAGLALQDFDLYEIHEAFAAQVLCTLKAWESPQFCSERLDLPAPLGAIDRAKLNVAGSSLALGHPFAATGARILATLAKLLAERQGRRGLISICTAGGMGVTAILER